MIIDNDLNRLKIGSGDCPSSNGNWQHDHRIPERNRRRQQKMKKSEKNIVRENLIGKSVKKWVEMKISGLKIGVILARWTY